jgi:uncharacterized protein (DUF2252 family)
MAADLADGLRTGTADAICGDAHFSDLGIFAAPDRRLVFSINDFDDSLPGPFEWDVKHSRQASPLPAVIEALAKRCAAPS